VGLTMDSHGALYGTASAGGVSNGCTGTGCGTVFKLTRHGSGWVFSPLYAFSGGSDGAFPLARVMLGPNGTLYGTTFGGGNDSGYNGDGVVFNLQPPPHIEPRFSAPWTETVLYRFSGVTDGNNPLGDIAFDSTGAIYGATANGGWECEDTVYCGAVFRLVPNGSGWRESVIYAFRDPLVALPQAGVTLDQDDNVYGTTTNGAGAVYELVRFGAGWTEKTLYEFSYGSGAWSPLAGVIFDPSGNLYGTTSLGGQNGVGTVFELSPSNGGWNESVIYNFGDGGDPAASLVRDAAGNLYGTTCGGGPNLKGAVFKLTPSGGSWTENDLYDFTGGTDGECPLGNVILDSNGAIYGTTVGGGVYSDGVVFEITQ
jgi:uncharacterized repeat protein (TIGR03803 family)